MKDDYKDAVAIEPEALEEEFVRLPADLARWNELYSQATGKHLEAKFKVERVYAKLYLKYRDGHDDEDNPKKRTEAQVKAMIDRDTNYQMVQGELVVATVEKARLYGIVDAIRAKKDSLVSIGAGRRAEMQSPRIRDHSHKDDEDDDDT